MYPLLTSLGRCAKQMAIFHIHTIVTGETSFPSRNRKRNRKKENSSDTTSKKYRPWCNSIHYSPSISFRHEEFRHEIQKQSNIQHRGLGRRTRRRIPIMIFGFAMKYRCWLRPNTCTRTHGPFTAVTTVSRNRWRGSGYGFRDKVAA